MNTKFHHQSPKTENSINVKSVFSFSLYSDK